MVSGRRVATACGRLATMDPELDHYSVLGVSEDANMLQIQQAYNRQVEKVSSHQIASGWIIEVLEQVDM